MNLAIGANFFFASRPPYSSQLKVGSVIAMDFIPLGKPNGLGSTGRLTLQLNWRLAYLCNGQRPDVICSHGRSSFIRWNHLILSRWTTLQSP